MASEASTLQRRPPFGGLVTALIEASKDGIIVLDTSMACVWTNTEARRLLRSDHATFSELQTALDAHNTGFTAVLTGKGDAVELPALGLQCRGYAADDGFFVLTLRSTETEQRLKQAELLARLARIDSPGHPDLGGELLRLISDHIPVDVAVLSVFDRDVLRPVAWQGVMLDPITITIPTSEPNVLHALTHREVVLADRDDWTTQLGIGAHVVVPLTGAEAVIGTLHIGLAPHASPSLDHTFLAVLGDHVAHAMESVSKFERLADEQTRLRIIIDRLPEGVLVFDGRGDVLIANPAVRRILEITPRNLNSDPRPYRLRDANLNVLARPDWPFFRAARLGQSIHDARIIIDFDGRHKHVNVGVVLVPSADGRTTHYLGTLQDVTERTESDQRKDEFLSVASHEMRSPLTPLKGFLQMAIARIERGESADPDILRRAADQVDRLGRLIDDMLDVTRIDSGQMLVTPRLADLSAVIGALIETRWPGRAVLNTNGEATAWVDVRRIEQVISNLVENALKYSLSPQPVVVEVRPCGATVEVHVTDHGRGIDEADLPHIFDRFYRAYHKVAGTGLGLYIARQIVDQHGGMITVQSELDVGTTFCITLPASAH